RRRGGGPGFAETNTMAQSSWAVPDQGGAAASAAPSVVGRTIIVTGGSRGLGRAMVLGLARAGARVAIVARGSSGPLDHTLAQLDSLGAPSQVITALGDLRDPSACDRIAADPADALGKPDVLVNNAAVPNFGPG